MAYNTTPFHGKVCRIEKNNVAIAFSDGWTLNVTRDMSETSSQGDSWKTGIPGLKSWNGTINLKLVAGNTEQKALIDDLLTGTAVLTDVKLLLDTSTNAFTGNIWTKGLGVTTGMGDKVPLSISFDGDGALALTDAA